MKILKNYEFITESRKLYQKIKQESLNYLAFLIDDGYEVITRDELRYITVYVEQKKVSREPSAIRLPNESWSGSKLSDIKDDIMAYFEYMDENYELQFIEFSGVKNTISDARDFGRSRFVKISELDDDDFYFSSIKIAFNKKWKK